MKTKLLFALPLLMLLFVPFTKAQQTKSQKLPVATIKTLEGRDFPLHKSIIREANYPVILGYLVSSMY